MYNLSITGNKQQTICTNYSQYLITNQNPVDHFSYFVSLHFIQYFFSYAHLKVHFQKAAIMGPRVFFSNDLTPKFPKQSLYQEIICPNVLGYCYVTRIIITPLITFYLAIGIHAHLKLRMRLNFYIVFRMDLNNFFFGFLK